MPSHTIVCLSSQSWDEPLWTNKQHIMSRLALEHRVIHVDFGLRPLPSYLWLRARARPADLLHPARLLTDGVMPRGGNLYVADSWNPTLTGLLPMRHPVRDFFSYDAKVLMVRRFLDRIGADDPIVWVYHPGYAEAIERLPRKLLVYDCVDEYTAFPKYRPVAAWIAERERRLCAKADVVFTTSRTLFEAKRPLAPDRTFLVHNVGDAEHFARAADPDLPIPADIAALRARGPVVGFVGAVSDYKLDVQWLLHAARSRRDWQIVVVGPVGLADPSTDVSQLRREPNVSLLGVRAYVDLPAVIKGFDVAVIPYRRNDYTAGVFPIKFFELLATGKPVVISDLPSLSDFHRDVLVADSAEAFVARCEEALHVGGAASRMAIARENSWPQRIATMMGHIEARLAHRAEESHAGAA